MLSTASEKKLARVKPDLVAVVHRAAEISAKPFEIVQGNRTQAEQNALYAQGRTKPGNIVTWTKKSKHIGGNAIDFAALVNGKISWNDKLYPYIAEALKTAARELKIGIEWGGDWKTKDWGHIQLVPFNPTPTKPTAGKGWTVTDIQNALVKHSFDPGPIDGVLGKRTRAALSAFQKAVGLPVTGGPDKATTDALAKKPAPAGTPVALMAMPETSVDMGPEPASVTPAPTEVGSPRWTVAELQQLGLSKRDAIAITAHLMWESGGKHGTINWSAHGDADHSHGAGQWNDRMGRFQALEKFAIDLGMTWESPEAQLRFLVHELQTTERKPSRRMAAATTLSDSVLAALSYWRPSIPHLDKRQAIATKLEQDVDDVAGMHDGLEETDNV